jgi:hypothetical protein
LGGRDRHAGGQNGAPIYLTDATIVATKRAAFGPP